MIVERIHLPSIDQSNCLNAIADPESTRDVVAAFYADCLRCANIHGIETIAWPAINRAIMARWNKGKNKLAGLNYIKEKAWKEAHSAHS